MSDTPNNDPSKGVLNNLPAIEPGDQRPDLFEPEKSLYIFPCLACRHLTGPISYCLGCRNYQQ